MDAMPTPALAVPYAAPKPAMATKGRVGMCKAAAAGCARHCTGASPDLGGRFRAFGPVELQVAEQTAGCAGSGSIAVTDKQSQGPLGRSARQWRSDCCQGKVPDVHDVASAPRRRTTTEPQARHLSRPRLARELQEETEKSAHANTRALAAPMNPKKGATVSPDAFAACSSVRSMMTMLVLTVHLQCRCGPLDAPIATCAVVGE
jgi:hypothetical protein